MLLRRGRKYYCRVWVPLDLRERIGRKELKKSLLTSNKKDAKTAATLLVSKAEISFFRMRSGMLTERELEQLTVSILAEFTGKVDEHRKLRSDAFTFLDSGVPIGLDVNTDIGIIDSTFAFPRTADDVNKVVGHYSAAIKQLEQQRATGMYSDDIRTKAKRIVRGRKLAIELPSPAWFNENAPEWHVAPPADFSRVCEAIIDGLINAYTLEMERVQGRRNPVVESGIAARIEAARQRPKLSDLWKAYKALKLATEKWNGKTLEKYEDYYRGALKFLGDRELTDYRQDDAIQFIEALKSDANRASTIRGKIEFLSSMFKFALKTPESVDRWKIKGNPFMEMQVRNTGADAPDKVPYTYNDLVHLLANLLRVRKAAEPHKFWVPLVGLYTGARQSEICQLRTTDIIMGGALSVFHFRHNPEQRQKIKNKRSRTCPVHPDLKRLGFLRFVEDQARAGQDRLFHTLSYSETKEWTGKIRTWWNSTFQKNALKDTSGKSFHSLRKSFVNWFKQNGAYVTADDRRILQSMIGHDSTDDVTSEHYEVEYPPETQYKLLIKLNYGFPTALMEALCRKEF